MDINLSLNETRIIGALLEKESTTPDLYPLTSNSLKGACNQKSNREPVLNLSDHDIRQTLDQLMDKRLIHEEGGSRVNKFKHRFCNTAFGGLQLTPQERAIVCVLFLRGPQTPGELRSRTQRLCDFSDVAAVDISLQQMTDKNLVVQLPREAGKRESRYAHTFSGEIQIVTTAEVQADDKQKLAQLQQENHILKAEIERLKAELTRLQPL